MTDIEPDLDGVAERLRSGRPSPAPGSAPSCALSCSRPAAAARCPAAGCAS